jgi:tagatose-1,6-bisphosphate aldolase
VSDRVVREVYLPPFVAAVEAGVAGVMCGYSTWRGSQRCISVLFALTRARTRVCVVAQTSTMDHGCVVVREPGVGCSLRRYGGEWVLRDSS